MDSFLEIDLPKVLLKRLDIIKFHKPTPIQAKTIPSALQGKDIFGSAQTGTGKTGAFTIPVLSSIIKNPESAALILAPTRELAMQILEFSKNLIDRSININTALLIGGQPMHKQLNQLRSNPKFIIGTPGRINDHLSRKTLKLNNIKFLILDEADRMLDMGFSDQLETIIKKIPNERQTLMFSATVPNDILGLANKYLKNPERVSIGESQKPAINIKLETLYINENSKFDSLKSELEKRNGSIIIFVKTKRNTEVLARKLGKQYMAEFLHGDLRQNKRDYVIRSFRNQKFRILVATDVAARGLDIPHIEHVINYDLPQCPEDYIHRIGRTARAGAEGSALCLVSSEDKSKWEAIKHFIETGKKLPMKGNKNKRNRSWGRSSSSDRGRNYSSDRGRNSSSDNKFSFNSRNKSRNSRSGFSSRRNVAEKTF